MISSTIYALSFLFVAATALPLAPRDVVAPPITYPVAGTVWTVGATETVTWDTSNLPPVANITNINGEVVLGYLTADSENLDFQSPLAQNFNITSGSVQIVVPDVPYRTNYILDLMGDSGNISPTFTIVGGSSSSSSAPASSTAPSSSSPVSSSPAASPSAPSSTAVSSPAESTPATAADAAPTSAVSSPAPSSVASSAPSSGSSGIASPPPSSGISALLSGSSTSSARTSASTSAATSATSAAPSATHTSTSGAWSWQRASGVTSLAVAALTAFVVL
ncbi:hypothetical protein BKA93DRAFT_822584 [Sparassis latifolia]|uniref:Uncharacterized protein n=1 Tax=Sparassis crispa TaxID=139825 RepID=A0A401GLS0_9APHY|nr:hypothetical protein SCP_0501750 [Sparassis crispa]GBE83128.1 hypothetical protein SCP_0501750 [Sparassis crispa]